MSKTIRGIQLKSLVQWQTGNLGFTLLGIFYLLFPWFTNGALDTGSAMFGMMFLSVGILRAKAKATVLGGLFAALLGITYFATSVAWLDTGFTWMASILLFIGFVVFEMGFIKFGPVTEKAKTFIVVPLALLSFSLILAFVGYNPMLTISWSNIWVALNYLAVLLFAMFSMLSVVGWDIMGKNTSKWVMLFAVAAIATAFIGTYQGTLQSWLAIFPLKM